MDSILEQLKKPPIAAAVGALVGLALGLIIAWGLWPVQIVDTTPATMREDLKVDYLRMVIDSFQVNADPNAAIRRWNDLGASAEEVLGKIKADYQNQNPLVVDAFESVIIQAQGNVAQPGAELPGGETATPSSSSFLLVIVAVVLIFAVAVALFFYWRRFGFGRRGSGDVTPQMQAQQFARSTERTDFQSMGLAQPITQTMTTYVLGDDLYDESFSIDSPAGEFLGEYGVGVSETIGVGDPKKVTAFEVWLFDKNDIKTATKVLMSAHAFNDTAISQRLEAKGELVLLEPHKQILLETATLQLLATVADVEYGNGPLPADSYFDRLTLELAVWPKSESPTM
jgi:hypothetical protein